MSLLIERRRFIIQLMVGKSAQIDNSRYSGLNERFIQDNCAEFFLFYCDYFLSYRVLYIEGHGGQD